eukprot:scaffold55974_cov33-Tisochrysis_lutea.AAC.1
MVAGPSPSPVDLRAVALVGPTSAVAVGYSECEPTAPEDGQCRRRITPRRAVEKNENPATIIEVCLHPWERESTAESEASAYPTYRPDEYTALATPRVSLVKAWPIMG